MLSLKKTFFTIIGLICASIIIFLIQKEDSPKIYTARSAMEYAESQVREKKPAPTESALLYAYTATSYYETLVKTGSTEISLRVARHVVDLFFQATSSEVLTKEENDFAKPFIERFTTDGRKNISFVKPNGDYVWIDRDTNPKTPFTPNAGKWKRWNVEGIDFKVPQPPIYMSEKYKQGLEEVKLAASMRTSEQSAAINFWGGIPGTNQPAGIWLDFFYETNQSENLSEKEFAYAQMILAQTLSDSFMECWKVKYTYWTKRPDMRDEDITTAMPNPPFPSYVSGHSAISFSAAAVLGEMFPNKKDLYLKNAEEAKNSRLWAGIHFPYDNEEGKKLGIAVGEEVISKVQLKAIRK